MRAKVTKEFKGRRDNEAVTTTFHEGDEIEGDLARVAVENKWASEITRKARAGDILAWGLFASYIWRWLEHGTKNMRAQPHIFPTYRSMKKRFRSRMGRAVRKAVKKVAEK